MTIIDNAFIHIPKTGGITIKSLLERYITVDNGHRRVDDALRAWKDIESHSELAIAENRFNQPDLSDHPIYLFTFMRNPYTRVISTYEFRLREWDATAATWAGGPWPKSYRGWVDAVAAGYRGGFEKNHGKCGFREFDTMPRDPSFKEYIDFITTIGDNDLWEPQTNWMHPLINYVGKTETLAEDVKIIADNIGLPEKEKNDLDLTLKENISPWRHKNYKDYYDDESRKKVEKYYERDIDFLKVKF